MNNLKTVDKNLRRSFTNLKKDILVITKKLHEQHEYIAKLVDNQKYLMQRIKDLEKPKKKKK